MVSEKKLFFFLSFSHFKSIRANEPRGVASLCPRGLIGRNYVGDLLVRLSLLTMTNPNQLFDVLLFVCSKMADETNLISKLPVADRTREV